MSLVNNLYKLARTANTISVIMSGNPKRIRRRAKNIIVGRTLRKAGVWRKLWH